MRRLIVLAALLGLSTALAGAVEGAGPAQVAGTVVFTSNRDGDYDIWAVNPDGTGLTQLTNSKHEESFPVPSPDGSLIAFYHRSALAVMNADGSGRREIPKCTAFTTAAWAPDSARLVCERSGGGLTVVEAASGAVTQLTAHGRSPSWSPDGQTIAFVNGAIWLLPASGGTPVKIVSRGAYVGPPSWSPDSQRLAYTVERAVSGSFRYDLVTVRADGSGKADIVRDTGSGGFWSADGSLIAVARRVGKYPRDTYEVFTVRPDGTALRRETVSRGGESSFPLGWTGDGDRLVYVRQRYRETAETDVFLMSPGEGAGRALTEPFPTGGNNSEPRWRPGPPVSGMPVAPPTLTVPLDRNTTTAGAVERVAVDGRRAIPYAATSCSGVKVWNSKTLLSVRTRRLCADDLAAVVLSGSRLAWISYYHANSYEHAAVGTMRVRGRRPTYVTSTALYEEGGGDDVGGLVSGSGTIAFTSYRYLRRGGGVKRRPWLLLGRPAGRCPTTAEEDQPARLCRRLEAADGAWTAAIDGGRILTVRPCGCIRVLSTRGQVLTSLHVAGRIADAELGGHTIAVQRRASVTAYSAATGAKQQTRPLAVNEGAAPRLLDVHDDIAVYATGGAVHLLRFSDGSDVALDLPGAAPYLDAKFDGGGLFVTWNQMFAKHPGRLAFIPLRTIDSEWSSP